MVKQLFRIMLMLALLLGAHGAPSGGWLSGVCGLSGAEAHAAQAFVFETGQTTSYATGDDGALRPGVAWPAPRFSDNGNGTVTDNLTGLIWLKNAGCFEMAIWDEALDISNNLASGVCGLSDGSTAGTWRLPNAKELESLVDLQNTDPALPSGHPFSNVQAAYWSSSTYAGYSSTISDYINHGTAAWMVDMEYGYMIWDDKPFWHAWSNYHYVWPVRGGQSGSLGLLNVYPAGNYFGDFFTNTTSCERTFTISNSGLTKLVVSSIALTGGNSDMFTLNSGTCGATPTIAPLGSCTISATFTPTSAGIKRTTLRIISNDPVTPNRDVPLSGMGKLPIYTIGTSVVGGHGGIICDSPVFSGAMSHCAIYPDAGYYLATFTDNTVNKLASVVANAYGIPAVTSNHAIAGTFAIDSYTVIFNSNGGSVVASQNVAYNGTATAPDSPIRTGYSFAGWYSDAALTKYFSFSTPITSNITLYAKWTVNSNIYTVSFNSNGGSVVASQNVAYNGTATAPASPIRTGYSFAGWYSDAALTKYFSFSTPITSNTTLYAKWTINGYTVSFNSNGGSAVASQHVAYNGTATAPVAPTRTGYTFVGWYSNAALTTVFSFSAHVTSNITLYAKWTVNSNIYTVSFNSNGGSVVASQNVAYNGTATAPASPTRTGYTFAGWYSNSALTTTFSFSTPITSNTTLYAKWTINSYTVSFNSNGGSAVASQHVACNGTATAPASPIRTGYSFAGWYSDVALTTFFGFSTPITHNTTLYAKWTVNSNIYIVSFNSNGGSSVASQQVAYNGAATLPVAPTRIGYTFAGWYSNSALTTSFGFSTPITSNITLYAKWTINSYTVSFNSNGGSAVASQQVAYNGTATLPVAPTRAGYIFAGWYSSSALTTTFSFSTHITSNITLYAKWTIQLPRTGQTKCYNRAGTEIPCGGTGQDGEKLMGVAWPNPRFTDNGNGAVTDNLTGLIWLKNPNCTDTVGGIDKSSGILSWIDALIWSNRLASGQCGLSDGSAVGDWRLPNINELESLVDLRNTTPPLPTGHPFSNVWSGRYWSSSSQVVMPQYAWVVYIGMGSDDGSVDYGGKSYDGYVWPVRGGQ